MHQQKKDIFLLITTNCTLKCFGCGYGCEKKEDIWYITQKNFENIILKLKYTHLNNSTNYSINITGGDPLLHPKWLEFALFVRKTLPNQTCYISTNAPSINALSDETLLFCKNNEIHFGITVYPSMQLLPTYLNLEKKLKKLNIIITWNPIKLIFGKTSFNNKNNSKKYINCYKHMMDICDFCIIYKNKIYNCQNAFYQARLKDNNNDHFSILDLKNNENLKNIKSFKDCENCKIDNGDPILWHFNSQLPLNCTTTPLKELFLNDYKTYYILIHDCKEHLECLKQDFFKKYFKPNFGYNIIQNRFFKGKLDIFIPFNNYFSNDIISFFKKQTIFKDCNFYFVSYTKDYKINEQVFDNFYSPNMPNNYFLKAKNLYDSYYIFLNNSYLKNKITINLETLKDLTDFKYLEKRYLKLQQ